MAVNRVVDMQQMLKDHPEVKQWLDAEGVKTGVRVSTDTVSAVCKFCAWLKKNSILTPGNS